MHWLLTMIYLKKKNYFYKIKNSNKFLNLPFVPVQPRWHLPKKSTIYVLKHFALWHHFDIVKKDMHSKLLIKIWVFF